VNVQLAPVRSGQLGESGLVRDRHEDAASGLTSCTRKVLPSGSLNDMNVP
jgi:hypothetical protein